ncbi:hypothetical protein N7475_000693 [Penicillium sp. IBT 31633x]|nr:hypothetical protein N7475_000693 [Penicillium sp. IBT 31633x]
MKAFCRKLMCGCSRKHRKSDAEDIELRPKRAKISKVAQHPKISKIPKRARTPEEPKAPQIPEVPKPAPEPAAGDGVEDDNEVLWSDSDYTQMEVSDDDDHPQSHSNHDSHTGITPEMSEAGISDNDEDSQYLPSDQDPEAGLAFEWSAAETSEGEDQSFYSDSDVEMANSDDSESMLHMGKGKTKGQARKGKAKKKSVSPNPERGSHGPVTLKGAPETASGIQTASGSERSMSNEGKQKREEGEEQRSAHSPEDPPASTEHDIKRRRLDERKSSSDAEIDTRSDKDSEGQQLGEIVSQESDLKPTDTEVSEYRRRGAEFQAWIEDPNVPGCNIAPATLTLQDLINNPASPYPFQVKEQKVYPASEAAIRLGSNYGLENPQETARSLYIDNLSSRPETIERYGIPRHNTYSHTVGKGILAVHMVERVDGPYWNEIGKADYENDYSIDTLRHVYITSIENRETAPLIQYIVYPRHGVNLSQLERGDDSTLTIEHGTAEYQEVLGTTLGRSVARLVLSSFPRGTRRISRIVTSINELGLNMRLDIEEMTTAPLAALLAPPTNIAPLPAPSPAASSAASTAPSSVLSTGASSVPAKSTGKTTPVSHAPSTSSGTPIFTPTSSQDSSAASAAPGAPVPSPQHSSAPSEQSMDPSTAPPPESASEPASELASQ